MNNCGLYASVCVQLQLERSYMVLGCTGIQHTRLYSGLDRALTMNAQDNSESSPPNISPLAARNRPANGIFCLFDANPDHIFLQLYNANSYLQGSVSIERYSSSLDGALG